LIRRSNVYVACAHRHNFHAVSCAPPARRILLLEYRMSQDSPRTSWPTGYLIKPCADALPDGCVDFFRAAPAAVVADCAGLQVACIGLRPFHGAAGAKLCGPALTVRVRPGDNLMIHKALLMARAGDVIVVDGAGYLSRALVGGLMRATALAKGLGGFVVDGAIRDLDEWADGKVPVYARGHTPQGPEKQGPGEINVPVVCGGIDIVPGDLVIGDTDGAIAVPRKVLHGLAERVTLHLRREASIREQNAAGRPDAARIDDLLRARGVPV
jgi:RraA family protein